jgi:phage shock protein C
MELLHGRKAMSGTGNDIKRLYRSRKERVFFGVCGGIAEYLEVDPVVVRILAVISFFGFGFGLLLYIIGAIIIPENPNQQPVKERAKQEPRSGNWHFAIGAVLVILGGLMLLDNFDVFDHGWFRFHFFPWRLFWPLLFLAIGIYLVTSGVSIKDASRDVKGWARRSRLHKSRSQKMIAGVCGGLAEYWDQDPNLVRLIAAAMIILTGGVGVLIYIAAALIFPYADEMEPDTETVDNGNTGSGKPENGA